MKTESTTSPTYENSTTQVQLTSDSNNSMTPSQQAAINKTLQETPGFRMRKFNKNKRFKENYFEMRMMDTSANTCSSFESSFNGNIYHNNFSKVHQITKRKATSNNTTQSKKRKKSQSNIDPFSQQSNSFTNMNSIGTISTSFPIVSFESDAMVKSSSLPSFALSSSVIDQEFPNLNDNFFSTDPSTTSHHHCMSSTTYPAQQSVLPNVVENTSSLVELLMSTTNPIKQEDVVNKNAVPNANDSKVNQQHVVAPITELKTLIGESLIGITSSCNNSITSPSASSSMSNTTVCNHLMINDQTNSPSDQCSGQQQVWSSILPLKPVCFDEICSEWEQLLSSNVQQANLPTSSTPQQTLEASM